MQGPHHVANQSTTTTGFLAMVSLKAAALENTKNTRSVSWNPHRKIGAAIVLLAAAASCRTYFGRAARASQQSAAACFCVLEGPGRGSARTTHVSMLWTVILGSVEWNDLAKVIRADVDRGVLEVDVRVAMFRSGRRNCFAGICIAGGRDSGVDMLGELPVAPFLYLLYSDRVTSSRGETSKRFAMVIWSGSWGPQKCYAFPSLRYQKICVLEKSQ